MKKLIITIDTEGDDLWHWRQGQPITTENTLFLPRFQKTANRYGFYPVWLANEEMISDQRFIRFIRPVERDHLGEIGMHLHAWNSPPDYALPVQTNHAPYLIEYPPGIMDEKISSLTDHIRSAVGIQPVSHRAGRWATDSNYFVLLQKHGYLVDCSVTPHVDWSRQPGQTACSGGSNYQCAPEQPYMIDRLLETPVTILSVRRIFPPQRFSATELAKSVYRGIRPRALWLRPNGRNLRQMLYLLETVHRSENDDYAMFMLHSSELMPGGSPTFPYKDSIEKLYADLEALFAFAAERFEGSTLRQYQHAFSSSHSDKSIR